MQVCRPFFVTLTKAFFYIIVSLIQLGCPGLLVAELQIQILPLIENLEWLYIWGVVVRCSIVRHRP